jgi:RND family efflux transporter MFP subunit
MTPVKSFFLARLAGFLAILVALFPGCQSPESGTKGDEDQLEKTVRVETLGRTDIAEVLRYVADLHPRTEVKIFSQIPDRILYFPWENGDFIQRGQRIALIRKEGMDHALDQMAAQEEALDVQLHNLESELKRSRELLSSGVITQPVFDKLQTTFEATVAQRKALKAGKSQLAVQAGNAVIQSPINGIIAGKMLEKGDMAVPQMPLCRVMDIERLKVILKLVEEDVTKVRIGMEVLIHLDCCPNEVFKGELSRIFPYLNPDTRTNTVEVTLENPRDESGLFRLKPGMFGQAELVVEMRENVLAAPEPALLLDNLLIKKQRNGEILRKAFIVDENNTARLREVRLGSRKGSLYEVKNGLADGERIVVRGQHGLHDGQKVEIVSAEK